MDLLFLKTIRKSLEAKGEFDNLETTIIFNNFFYTDHISKIYLTN